MDGQAQAQRLGRWARIKRTVTHYKQRGLFQLYLLYCRTLYRPHMRWLHWRGKHWYTHLRFAEPQQFWCQWCGDRYIHLEN